ncbi:hypothetical protein Tco_0093900, partial [Tanacetum coccineum]
MFLKYSTNQIPPKKSRGKGSQGKKTTDTLVADVDVSDESEPEPTKKKAGSRSTRGVVIQEPPSALKPKPVISKLKLKGVQSLTPEEQETTDTIQALKENQQKTAIYSDEDEEKKDDDKSNDLDMIDDEETEDEFVHGDEQVNDDEDEKMTETEVTESEKGDEEVIDAVKADVEKTEEVKDDTKKAEFPSTSSNLSV